MTFSTERGDFEWTPKAGRTPWRVYLAWLWFEVVVAR